MPICRSTTTLFLACLVWQRLISFQAAVTARPPSSLSQRNSASASSAVLHFYLGSPCAIGLGAGADCNRRCSGAPIYLDLMHDNTCSSAVLSKNTPAGLRAWPRPLKDALSALMTVGLQELQLRAKVSGTTLAASSL